MSFGEANLINADWTLKILNGILSIKLSKGEFKILKKELNFILLFIGGRVVFTLSNAKHGGEYWNRSRGKLDFKGFSGKDYGAHGLN